MAVVSGWCNKISVSVSVSVSVASVTTVTMSEASLSTATRGLSKLKFSLTEKDHHATDAPLREGSPAPKAPVRHSHRTLL